MIELAHTQTSLTIQLGEIRLNGILTIPKGAKRIVIFSHGSGSSHLSPRNNFVAGILNEEKIATLLFDLLTREEDKIYKNRFNINLLSQRLIEVTKWIKQNSATKIMNIGYFGASTGAASALRAAAYLGEDIKAIVSRGGRPDLAMNNLSEVTAPTLLIVGGLDLPVIELNNEAFKKLQCEKRIEIVPGASHLFEEPRKLEDMTILSKKWFKKYL
ncbi:dienelactone hydrolase family protein [Abyssalbus ytuae]|uniref:Alpha/beta hydrolase n=1 Tax=Abyssalbus ytuae TaxID=2926907 RepID=A0A9E6ZLD7_9FLAO|nr:alpha/beta hydrolase [Abyssalbus ytuae]UOB17927.1 alpha/beta hydrolase [Abyssalbus ytuae]